MRNMGPEFCVCGSPWAISHSRTQTRVPYFAYRRISVLYKIYSTIPSSLSLGLPFCHIVNLNFAVSWTITIVYDIICGLVLNNHTFLKACKMLHISSHLSILLLAPNFAPFYIT